MRKLLAIFALLIALDSHSAIITVTYATSQHNGGPVNNWSSQAQAAFERAVEVVEESIYSPFEIKIIAFYEDLVQKHNDSTYYWVLGYSQATDFKQDFGSPHPAYIAGTQYPIALAEKLRGQEYTTFNRYPHHIIISMNSNQDSIHWHLGLTYGSCGSMQHDFVTTAVHEILHGLGFASSARRLNNGVGAPSYDATTPTVYDRYVLRVVSPTNILLTSLAASGSSTTAFLESDQLYWDGAYAVATHNSRPRLHAPTTFQQGSSVSHWRQGQFVSLNSDAIMHPGQGYCNQNFYRNLGNVTVSLMRDIGWEDWPQGIPQQAFEEIRLYPNPTNSLTALQSEVGFDGAIEVINSIGQTIYHQVVQQSEDVILDFSVQPTGIYFIKVSSTDKQHTFKLVKSE